MSGSLSGGAGPPLALTAVTGRPHLFHLFLLVAKSEIIPIVPHHGFANARTSICKLERKIPSCFRSAIDCR